MELDFIGLGRQIVLLEWKVTGRKCSWNLSYSTVQSLLEQFIIGIRVYSHALYVTLNFNATYSALEDAQCCKLSALLLQLLKSLTTVTREGMFPLDTSLSKRWIF
jgi:hypothetical protein